MRAGTVRRSPIREYTAKCLHCGREDVGLWASRKMFEQSLRDAGWTTHYGFWHCPVCRDLAPKENAR